MTSRGKLTARRLASRFSLFDFLVSLSELYSPLRSFSGHLCADVEGAAPIFPQISTILSNPTPPANPLAPPTCTPLCQPSLLHSSHVGAIKGLAKNLCIHTSVLRIRGTRVRSGDSANHGIGDSDPVGETLFCAGQRLDKRD